MTPGKKEEVVEMEEMEVKSWEGKSLRVVVEELKAGWFWYSPAIPRAWGRALEQVFKDQLGEIKVLKAVYRKGMIGRGANSRYWFDLILKVDRDVEKEIEGKVMTKEDALFGTVPKKVRVEGDTIILSAMY